ncbi:MAG: 4Fe-4S dicluster domain-containing protein [candidate division WOR-3 bacterium]|nr:4Fe-4S dicluster domain-containing protein [candidate division WOR-3 bacterium]MDW8113396.1 4Fe-4S dicluster domain-containing protein [candidate division WOR-3 bacterium]
MKEIKIYVMGKEYLVPEGLTIMQALEYCGFFFVRGAGCRGGFCGACSTVYRKKDSFRLKVGLACQTKVEEGMYLTQLPFYPANKAIYNIEELSYDSQIFIKYYPEILRCIACGSCNRVCPQDLKVMEYINAAIRGDVKKVAEFSFDCIMCGLCASRCPAEIVQYYVGLLGRRIYGRLIQKKAKDLEKRIKEIEEGKFEKELEELMKMSIEKLKELYEKREIEAE